MSRMGQGLIKINLLPAKRSWRCGRVFDVFPDDEEAVTAVIRVDGVLRLDETCEGF